jgi:hypothetical protein
MASRSLSAAGSGEGPLSLIQYLGSTNKGGEDGVKADDDVVEVWVLELVVVLGREDDENEDDDEETKDTTVDPEEGANGLTSTRRMPYGSNFHFISRDSDVE